MKAKSLILTVTALIILPLSVAAEVVYSLDFSDFKDGEAAGWFKKNGYKFQLDADDLSYTFKDGNLVIYNEGDISGLLYKEIKIENVKRVRIEWGINKYPIGIDWENGVTRDAAMVIVTFGTKKISSGSLVVPNLPYFFGIFLGEKEVEGKAYTGSYFKKGGRYFCYPCQVAAGKTVVTDFEVYERFKKEFKQSKVPPITSFAIESDTRDLDGDSSAYIRKIEFLSN